MEHSEKPCLYGSSKHMFECENSDFFSKMVMYFCLPFANAKHIEKPFSGWFLEIYANLPILPNFSWHIVYSQNVSVACGLLSMFLWLDLVYDIWCKISQVSWKRRIWLVWRSAALWNYVGCQAFKISAHHANIYS